MARHRKRGAIVWGALIGLLALSGGASPAPAADLKIGFIDSDQIFANYQKTRDAQESFNREVVDLSKTAREKKDEIDAMQRKLDQQGPMLSEAKRDEQNRILSQKVGEYEKFVQEQWGPGGKISRLNEEYLKPIIDRVHAIVASIGTDEGYSLILDAADGNVVYGDKSLDLTDRVLSELRTEDETGTRSGGKKP
jgi:outer membrane protein